MSGDPTDRVLDDIYLERAEQNTKWGEQNHPDGTGQFGPTDRQMADMSRKLCQSAAAAGMVTWRHILDEEVREAYAETDPVKLRAELVQVAPVAVAWVEAIDRRQS